MVGGEARWGDEDQLIAGLAEFGLGRNEARLYLAAVGRSSMRAAELAQLAGISRTKAYDALRLLVEKGLFTEEPGKVARFRAACCAPMTWPCGRGSATGRSSSARP